MVIKQSLRLSVTGIVVGMVVSFFACRLFTTQVSIASFSHLSNLLYFAVALPPLLITVLAALAPARRASLAMNLNILAVPGDGVGVEVTREAIRILVCIVREFGHKLSLSEALMGGAAFSKSGAGLPSETLDLGGLYYGTPRCAQGGGEETRVINTATRAARSSVSRA